MLKKVLAFSFVHIALATTAFADLQQNCAEHVEPAKAPFFERHRVVLDTNVILDDPHILEKFTDSEIIIPRPVLTELGRHRKDPVIGHASRSFMRTLVDLMGGSPPSDSFSIGNGCKVRIINKIDMKKINSLVEPDILTEEGVVDSKVIATALNESNSSDSRPLALVMSDNFASTLAMSLGIQTYNQRNFKKPVLPGVLRLTITESQLAEFYQNRGLPWSDPRAYKNQMVLLKTDPSLSDEDERTVLARFETDDIIPQRTSSVEETRRIMYSKHEGRIIPLRYAGPGYKEKIQPKNKGQRMLLELLLDPSIAVVWVQGIGGTGKTLLTAAAQIQQTMIQRPQAYQRAYFSRSSEGVGGERLGFLPGDANEKTGHLYDPLGDNLEVLKQITGWSIWKGNALAIFDTSPNQFQRIILAHSRGRSFNNVIWSVDEAQNLTDQQLATVVTRIGEGSKVIIMADTQQIDFKDPRESGFVRVMESYRGVINSAFVELTVSERSLAAAIGGVLNEDRLQAPSRGSRR